MKPKYVFILLFILLITSQNLYAQNQGEDKTFADPQERYTITLLEGWDKYTEEGEAIFTSSKGENDFATCYVFGFPVEQGMNLNDMASWMMEGFEEKGEGYEFKIRGKNALKLAGVDALLVKQEEIYKEKDFNQTIWIDEYYLIKGGQGIVIHFDTSKDSYGKFEKDFKKLVDSFIIGKKPFKNIIEETNTPVKNPNKSK